MCVCVCVCTRGGGVNVWGERDVNKRPGHTRPGWASGGWISGRDKESAANPDTIKAFIKTDLQFPL